MRRDAFSHYHPLVNIAYFLIAIGACMVLRHPLCQLLSLLAAFGYCLALEGPCVWRVWRWALPLVILATAINTLFSHEGVTVLLRYPSGTALTLESILYGLSSAIMLVTVILYFRAFSVVITTDKFLYLFGRIIPSLSLVLSMTLRFVPLFARRLQQVREAQRTLGHSEEGGFMHRLRRGAATLGTLVTWSLEKAIDTGDAMKSRGYGLPGRTAYSRCRFERRDGAALVALLLCAAALIVGGVLGTLSWQYYPTLSGPVTAWSAVLWVIYGAVCALPLILRWKEAIQWRSLTSNI